MPHFRVASEGPHPPERGESGTLVITRIIKARQGVELITSGELRVVDAVVHPDGFVEVRDRIKDVIISGGENISSVEVEGLLLQHPSVQEAAVVGVPHEKWGEAPIAFLILRSGATATPEELPQFVRDRLAHFKCPHAFHFVNELPKTATGKVQKFVLRGRRAGITAQ